MRDIQLKNRSATIIQKHYRGYLTRKKIHIRHIADGVIHIRIQGDEPLFALIDIEIDAKRGARSLDVLSVNPAKYQSRACGGDKFLNPIAITDAKRRKILGSTSQNIFINGAFFNSSGDYEGFEKFIPVGQTNTTQCHNFIPAPHNYADCFGQITFDDTSYISAAPLLSRQGVNQFPTKRLAEPRFSFETVRSGLHQLRPGDLYHAGDPNPRAGISMPDKNFITIPTNIPRNRQDRIRLVAVLASKRGADSDGFTMSEFASAMARFDRMNIHLGQAWNLDGGGSVIMGTTDSQGKITFIVAQEKEKGRDSSTMIVYNFKN
ncbi:hypothetical protein ACGVWS_05095 [Enterobacteriaceae bacterium LUAb1]